MTLETKTTPPPASSAGAVAAMGACYAMGTFTDNFYKQAAVLLAASLQMTAIQSIATVLFSLPYILFSAWAGWMADKAPKRRIVVAAKAMELVAMLGGVWMLLTANWVGILAVLFIMGTQATIFSPALNGSIPENFPPAQVPRANALIKLASTVAILAGMALAGVFLELRPESFGNVLPDFNLSAEEFGRAATGIFTAIVSLVGLAAALFLKKRPAASRPGSGPAFPRKGPLASVEHALACRKDPPLFLALLAEAWFYGIAAIAVISIANMALGFGYSKSMSGLMTAMLMIGIAAGSLFAGRFAPDGRQPLLVPSALSLAAMLLLAGAAPLLPAGTARTVWIMSTLFLCGVCGGVYLIPLASFIQVRPAADEKGKVIGVSNFLSFVAMSVFGAAFMLISLLPPALNFVFYGLSTALFALLVLRKRLALMEGGSLKSRASGPLALFLRAVLSLRYRVREEGLDGIPAAALQSGLPENAAEQPAPGILFLPNHPALIDPVLVYSRLAGLGPRPLADARQMSGLIPGLAARLIRAVTIPDMEKDGRKATQGVKEGIRRIQEALRRGDNVLLYPSGRIYRESKESLGGNSAVAGILAGTPGIRVVLVRTTGLWGSAFSRASGKNPAFMAELLRGALAVLANGLFFTPRRKVRMEFVEPDDLPRDGDKVALNRYLEDFYNQAETPAFAVPRFFTQGSAPLPLPEAASVQSPSAARTAAAVPDELRERVYALLQESAGLPAGQELSPEMTLHADLSLDSLSMMDVASALETEFGHPVTDMEALATVGDCLAAASGTLDAGAGAEQGPAPDAWFAADALPDAESILELPDCATVLEAFLLLARNAPDRPLTADRSGVRTRRQILTGVLALSRRFARLPGKRLGIMLPAAPASQTVWLAAMLAGKEPVMLNWTVGPRNMRHCIELSGISHAVTATALLDQLERTGNPVADMPVEWVAADVLASRLTLPEKLRAAAAAFLHCSPLPYSVSHGNTPEVAAVLFTSGSEAAPKAVPLTHRNIMTNASDIAAMLRVRRCDKLLAMLPPFHSFGLLVGLVLPAASGLAAAYHPNPTESSPLIFLVRDYKLTVCGATPTFLDGMLSRVNGSELASLRYAFVGAEKCPDHVYRTFARLCPGASLCEGYGITECSPVVSVNRPGSVVPGSIGHVLPSVKAAIVVESEDGSRRPAGTDESGMLLVRGPSIFSGYLGDSPSPFVEYEGDQWYRTGDLVARDADGRLFFKGRLKRFVKLGGEMISLPQMEEVLLSALAGRDDLPEDGRPAAAVEVRPGSEDAGQAEILAFTPLPLTVQDINAMLRKGGLAPVYAIRRVVAVREIPLLGTGKTDYRALQGLV